MTRSALDPTLAREVKDAAILIVDDNASNVDLVRDILIHEGYTAVRGKPTRAGFPPSARRSASTFC
ncbi:hypothetical protein [Azospirillum argentinense]|uniref:hypothetical protein n=1 Tax=Azospirillum argentinense TaxID=2970906 RepID=UPI00200059BD|nr:hypothetical protein [Azospirillum argentinense]